jgi:hypothetical protein
VPASTTTLSLCHHAAEESLPRGWVDFTGLHLAKVLSLVAYRCDGLASMFEPPIDPGILGALEVLREAGIETFESCQGGEGHAYPEPTIRFHGHPSEGFRAYAIALANGIDVLALRRVWDVLDQELTGPWWEITLRGQGPVSSLI